MRVFILLGMFVLLLGGCTTSNLPFASFSEMGQTEISVPLCQPTDVAVSDCPEAKYYSTKDIEHVELAYTRNPVTGLVKVGFTEQGISASEPLGVASEIIKSNNDAAQAQSEALKTIVEAVKGP